MAEVSVSTKTDVDPVMISYKLDHDGLIISYDTTHGLTGTLIFKNFYIQGKRKLKNFFSWTIVKVKNIFKNMPVRRNYLQGKTQINHDMKKIELLIKHFAICQPLIRFTLRINGKIIFTKGNCSNFSEAIKVVFGIQTFNNLDSIKKSFSQVISQAITLS